MEKDTDASAVAGTDTDIETDKDTNIEQTKTDKHTNTHNQPPTLTPAAGPAGEIQCL